MLDVSQLVPAGSTNVPTSDNIFSELGHNTYDFKDLISELIDNAIAAKYPDRLLKVTVDIHLDADGHAERFVISDDGQGIPVDRLGPAITPAGIISLEALNEHGLGMKQSVAAMGTLDYLATKVRGENTARVVRRFGYGDIPLFTGDLASDSGTEVAVKELKPIVVTNPTAITNSLVPHLGARYRRFLRPDNPAMSLILQIKKNDQVCNSWECGEIKPIYFHPSTRANRPIMMNYTLEGDGWRAQLTFGYAPERDEEYEELGIDKPTKFHPYHVSLTRQGLDIIRSNRVILFHQLSEINLVEIKHSDYNIIRGELDLIHGFSTAITKNSIIFDDHFGDCIANVREILTGKEPGPEGVAKNYLRRRTYPDEIPEKLLRDRLMAWLSSNPVAKREVVRPEYAIEGVEGRIDILADDEAWEIKPQQANALDVYQLFMYMDIGNYTNGYLVARDFSPGAAVAADHIKQKHGKTIKLSQLTNFPILHPPDETERAEYY